MYEESHASIRELLGNGCHYVYFVQVQWTG